MFSNARVGDRVYSFQFGWCRISHVGENSLIPLRITSEEDATTAWITLDGKMYPSYKDPTVFWDKPQFELPKKPLPDLKMNDLIFVQDIHGIHGEAGEWLPRHFRAFTGEGRVIVWEDGRTSYTTQDRDNHHQWDHWKLPEYAEEVEEE